MSTDLKCPICDSLSNQLYGSRYDDRYGYEGMFELMCCQECKHIFLAQDFTAEQIMSLYSNYYPRSKFDISSYQPHQEKHGFLAWFEGLKSSAFRWIPKDVRVLDIGCGFGESLGYHAARGCDVYGVEADDNIRRVADKYGFNVNVGLFDATCYEQSFFDYITMDQVLEHVACPEEVLKGVAKVLKTDGKVVLTLPNTHGWGARIFGKKWINWHAPYHMQFFSKASMRKLAENSGLKVESVQTITSSAWLHFQWLHLLTFPSINEPSDFWAGTACGKGADLSILTKIMMRCIGLLHKIKLNHLITRLFDAFGMGDSYVFILRKL